MKRLLIALVILILAYPIVTWTMGLAIEHRLINIPTEGQPYLAQLHLLQKSHHGALTADDDASYSFGSAVKMTRHFHRGWYVSTDDVTVEVTVPGLNPMPLRVAVHSVIHHGPFCGSTCFALAGSESHLMFTGTLQASIMQVFNNKEPLTIRSRYGFFGGGSSTYSSPAFEHAVSGRDAHVSWGGADGTMHYGAGTDWFDVAASAPALRVTSAKGNFEVTGMSLSLHEKRALRTLYAGDSRFELKHVAGGGAAQQVAVEDLVFASQMQLQDRYVNVVYQLGMGAIRTQPITLTGAHFDFTVKHLGVESLESLMVAMRSSGQLDATVPAAARLQTLTESIKKPGVALLLDQPELDFDRISVATAQGQALLTGSLRLDGATAADFDTPALLVAKLNLRVDVAIDEAFLAGLPGAGASATAQMQPLIDQGYATREKGVLRTQILVHGGQTTFNGKFFNPAAMMSAAPPPAAAAPPAPPPPPKSPSRPTAPGRSH